MVNFWMKYRNTEFYCKGVSTDPMCRKPDPVLARERVRFVHKLSIKSLQEDGFLESLNMLY